MISFDALRTGVYAIASLAALAVLWRPPRRTPARVAPRITHGRCVEGRSDEEEVGELRGRVLATASPRETDDPLAPGEAR